MMQYENPYKHTPRQRKKPEIGKTRNEDVILSRTQFKQKYKRKWFKGQGVQWWSPPPHAFVTEFCQDTTLHGIKFFVQPYLHISERIFWVISFMIGIAAAAYLILNVWTRYNNNPVIVTFNPVELDTDTIAFPAITICNMNKFPKNKIEEMKREAAIDPSSIKNLKFADSICNVQKSFSRDFNFSFTRGLIENENNSISGDDRPALINFLFESINCDELLRLCMWEGQVTNCSDLFRPISTNYGTCCAFNMLPSPLLFNRDKPRKADRWTEEEIREWRKLKFSEKWVILSEDLKFPRRQRRSGMPYGLSLLVDPNTDQYFCPVSDSEGVRYLVHSPLETAHVVEFGSAIGVGREVFIEIQPDVTLADPEIDDFPVEKRQCVFGHERILESFHPYTANNCQDECITRILAESCNCVLIYMPPTTLTKKICTEDDLACLDKTSLERLKDLDVECGHCEVLCEDVAYNYDTTWASLQDASELWYHYNESVPSWADHKMSIVHLYYGSDTLVPKVRKKLYGITDLIASIGGLLGLCLGVSGLTVVETIYFFTIRVFWKRIRRMTLGYRVANIFWIAYQKYKIRKEPKSHFTIGTQQIRDKVSVIDLDLVNTKLESLPGVYDDKPTVQYAGVSHSNHNYRPSIPPHHNYY